MAAPNDDLVGALASETFANDAVTATAIFPVGSVNTSSAAKAKLAISYDTASRSYSVRVASRSQTFGPATKSTALSTPAFNVFRRVAGSTTDTLSLATNATAVGTPSSPKFRYVGAGFFQRSITAPDGAQSGTADAFTYGAATPVAVVPHTGSATYAVAINAVSAYNDLTVKADGTGSISVDFLKGTLGGNGTLVTRDAAGNRVDINDWSMGARINATTRQFQGGIEFFRYGQFVPSTNGLNGRFYGPNGEELGATWRWHDNFLGITYVGTLRGKDATLFPSNTGLAKLVVNESFPGVVMGTQYYFNRDSQTYVEGYRSPVMDWHIDYSEVTRALTVDYFAVIAPMPLDAVHRDPATTTNSVQGYSWIQHNAFADGELPVHIGLFRPGAANKRLALTYTSFATWNVGTPDPKSEYYQQRLREGVFVFGRNTAAADVPRTGAATYTAVIQGLSDYVSDRQRPYVITGNASLAYDFGAATFTGSMNPVALDRETGKTYKLGAYAFSGHATVGSPTFVGNFARTSDYGENYIAGQFTGPKAQEFWGQWASFMADPVNNGAALNMFGVMVGKKN